MFSGDTLGGHLDDMEKDWSRPIVSMRCPFNHAFVLMKIIFLYIISSLWIHIFVNIPQFGLQSDLSSGREI